MAARIREHNARRGRPGQPAPGATSAANFRHSERGSRKTGPSCTWHNWLMEEGPFETDAGQACPIWHHGHGNLPTRNKEEL